MFGNSSFFAILANPTANATSPPPLAQVCASDNVPFTHLSRTSWDDFGTYCSRDVRDGEDAEEYVAEFLTSWPRNFNSSDASRKAMEAAMFFANQAVLTKTVAAEQLLEGRKIFTAPGTVVEKPKISTAALVVVSGLIALQAVGLAWLVWFIYSVPTWTAMSDAAAVARVGREIEGEALPPTRRVGAEELEKLQKIDGLIGVVEEEQALEEGSPRRGGIALGLEVSGLLTRRTISRK